MYCTVPDAVAAKITLSLCMLEVLFSLQFSKFNYSLLLSFNFDCIIQ